MNIINRLTKGSVIALTLVLSSLSSISAQEIDIPFEKFTLDNGLTVVVHEDRKAPVVAVAVWYKVGSKDEPEGKSGFAHLFEHLMFNGSENYDDEWFKPLQEVGATGLNGTTFFDRTNYFQTVPTPALDRILWMESDRMGHFLGAITQEKLDEQRGVVQNEKRQGEDQPYGKVFEHIIPAIFPPGHPYSHTVIGSMDDLNKASLEDVEAWFKQYYGAANAILVLSGDINAEQARPLVEKYFADIASGPALTKWEAWVPNRTVNTREMMQDKVPNTRIYRVWVAPEDTSKVSTDLLVAANVLGDGKNSRLYKELVYNQQIATSASVFNLELEMASIFGLVIDVAEGIEVATVEKELDKVMAKFLNRGPSTDEVELVSTKTKASIIRQLEEVGGFGGKAQTLAQGELLVGDPGFFKTELQRLERVKSKDVLEASRKWLGDGWHQITVKPFPEYTNAASGVDRTTGLPDVTGETKLVFPTIEQATLSNGMMVNLAKRSTIPVVNVAIQFDAGFAADKGNKLGLANFTTAMLDEGAGKYDALELAGELERLGAELSAGSTLDTTTVSMSVLPIIYGGDHAYGIPFTGTGSADSVSQITRDDMLRFKRQWMRPDNGTIFVVGDTTMAEIKPLLEQEFGKWQEKGDKLTKEIATVSLPQQGQAIIIDRPGSSQSLILAAHIAPPTGVKNNIAIDAMNETLGGAFTARVNMNLREDKGWAYGAYTFLQEAKGQRPFMVYAPVQTDKTGDSLKELVKELNAYKGNVPPTNDELERVVLDRVRSLPGRFETSSAVLSSLLSSNRFDRPLNYPESLPEKYGRLSTSDLEQAAEQVLNPDKLTWIIIGDASVIKAEVEAAGIGAVTVKSMQDL